MRLIYSRTSFLQNMCLDIRTASQERTAISLDFPIHSIFLYPMPCIIGYLAEEGSGCQIPFKNENDYVHACNYIDGRMLMYYLLI